jgi:o-succinylbenzoate synthase
MIIKASYTPYNLQFKLPATTSRGTLTQRHTYYILVQALHQPLVYGIGEASPLAGLSIDDRPDLEEKIAQLCHQITGIEIGETQNELLDFAEEFVPDDMPSLRFALETALLDLTNGGSRIIFQNDFSAGVKQLIINGLIWMDDIEKMQEQIEEKIKLGFRCIKMKIGALDFDNEIQCIKKIRQHYTTEQITIRVDANGAFSPSEALDKLKLLADLGVHSIEQPIRAGQEELMAKLCKYSPLPIALDEELISKSSEQQRLDLLEIIHPAYIILKPTLLGGFRNSAKWIELAESLQIGWWFTSALESNIGLNAISQFTAEYNNSLPQGLGTGALYHNNIPSPLRLEGDLLSYNPQRSWSIPF